ncbi:unnamed protein product [Heligmosomoides polygyrus]|uniref:Ketoacyl-synt_C domain-containing protein n=1 Tax=Heligmosomoides polygyrus TaxID=6339 RepID=A0A183F9W0_HELPZ|nr:unnamed protein product [Heligmosomoides polygyrus]
MTEVETDRYAELPRNHPHSTLDSHRTLWMGDLQPQWDAQFIEAAFKELGHTPSTVKMVTDKQTGVKAFDSVETDAVVEELRTQGVSTQYIRVSRELYSGFTTKNTSLFKDVVNVKRGPARG